MLGTSIIVTASESNPLALLIDKSDSLPGLLTTKLLSGRRFWIAELNAQLQSHRASFGILFRRVI